MISKNVYTRQIGFFEECVGFDVCDEIIIYEEHFYAVWNIPTSDPSDAIEGHIERLETEIRPGIKVSQFRDSIFMEVNPLELGRNESIVEPCQVIV